MRADAKVYTLTDENKNILSINASLKNLVEKMIETRRFSRSMPKRAEIIKILKNGPCQIPLKDGSFYTIQTNDLGVLSDLPLTHEAPEPQEGPDYREMGQFI